MDFRTDAAAEAYRLLGQALRQGNDLIHAEAAFRRAVAADPGSMAAQLDLAGTLAAQGRWADSAAQARASAARWPHNVEPLVPLADALQHLGEAAAAERVLGEALALAPEHPHLHYCLARVLLAQDRAAAAEQAYGRAVALAPDVPHYLAGLREALFRQERWDEARAVAERVVALEPQAVDGHVRLARVLTRGGAIDDAVAAQRRALELAPDSPDLQQFLAHLLLMRGEAPAAEAAMRGAVLQDAAPARRLVLSASLAEQGLWDEAAEQAARAVALLRRALAQDGGAILADTDGAVG